MARTAYLVLNCFVCCFGWKCGLSDDNYDRNLTCHCCDLSKVPRCICCNKQTYMCDVEVEEVRIENL